MDVDYTSTYTVLTVNPDVLLMATLQCCGALFWYWLTELFVMQVATFNWNLLEQVAKFGFSFYGATQGYTSSDNCSVVIGLATNCGKLATDLPVV